MTTSLPNNWIALQTAEEVAQKVTEQVLLIADESISQKGSFHFITAGGTPPAVAMNCFPRLILTGNIGIFIWGMSAVILKLMQKEIASP
jgi:hypothetical protein